MSTYWDRRAEADMDIVQAQAERRLVTIGKSIHSAQAYLTEEARKIFTQYRTRFGMTEEEALAELQKPITRLEYDQLLTRLATMPDGPEKVALEAQANRGAYAYRITRAETLKANIAIETAKISQVVEDETTKQLQFTAVEAFDRRTFALQQQAGRAFASPAVGSATMALDTPWSGQSYSARIWKNQEALAKALEEKITAGFLSGKAYRKTAQEISEELGVTFRQAERLVRTETSYISNQADIQAYKRAGIERYRFTAALDDRTCDTCGPMDLEVFEVVKAQVGENLPPIHPWCRCTTVAVLDKDKPLEGQRRGRDADGKSVLLPRDMTFEEWKEWQKAGAPEDIEGWRAVQNASEGLHEKRIADTISLSDADAAAEQRKAALHDAEMQIKDLDDHEEGFIVGNDGTVIFHAKGKAHSVAPPIELVKDNIFTHNHPGGPCSFSLADVKMIIASDGSEVRAVTADGRYVSLARGAAGWDSAMAAKMSKDGLNSIEIILRACDIAVQKYGRSHNAQQLASIIEALSNSWMRENAAKYGAVFTEGEI